MARIDPTKLKKLNDQEEAFLANLVDPRYSQDPQGLRRAYVDAGYSDSRSATCNARTKLRELSDHIQLRIHEKIGSHIPWALNELVQLAKTTKNEQVKLKALLNILDRGGYATPIVIEHIKDDPKDMTREQLRKEVEMLVRKMSKDKPALDVIDGGKK